MTSKFKKAVKNVLVLEGGYVNNPRDIGGETKYGITALSYPNIDIKSLTKAQAIKIYFDDYWMANLSKVPSQTITCEDLSQITGEMFFDIAVNMGIGRAMQFFEITQNPFELFAMRIRHYTTKSKTWDDFGKGWMNRIANVADAVAPSYENPQLVSAPNNDQQLTNFVKSIAIETSQVLNEADVQEIIKEITLRSQNANRQG